MTAPYPRERMKAPRRHRNTLPQRVREAFRDRAFLNLAQLAAAFGYSTRTLVRFCDLGLLNWHQRGVGTLSRHRAFTRVDVEEFWNLTERMELDALNQRRRTARERNAASKGGRS